MKVRQGRKLNTGLSTGTEGGKADLHFKKVLLNIRGVSVSGDGCNG